MKNISAFSEIEKPERFRLWSGFILALITFGGCLVISIGIFPILGLFTNSELLFFHGQASFPAQFVDSRDLARMSLSRSDISILTIIYWSIQSLIFSAIAARWRIPSKVFAAFAFVLLCGQGPAVLLGCAGITIHYDGP